MSYVNIYLGIKLLDTEDSLVSKPSEKLTQPNFFMTQSHKSDSKSLPYMKTSSNFSQHPDSIKKSRLSELRVIMTHSSNTLLMHQVVRNQGALTNLVIANYTINGKKFFSIEGLISFRNYNGF